MRVGIYLRISDDKDGTSTATERQRVDLERWLGSRGWELAGVYEDSDLSAYKRNVKRTDFERALSDLRSKQIDGLASWKLDRLVRTVRDLARLEDACEDSHGFFASMVDGIDTSTSAGRFTAGILTNMARMESENIAIRGARKHLELAQAGKPSVGGHRMFGYTTDRKALMPEEAVLVREAASRILAGESLRGVCMDWRCRGVSTTTGREWQQAPLKRLLMSSALSAQREIFPPGTHYLERRRGGGQLVPGTWPAILSPDDTRRLRLVLGDKARMKNRSGNARKYLLTGFLRCGRCNEPMFARPRLDHVRRYVCATYPGHRNCGKLARLAEPVEELVKDAICFALDGADLRAYVDEPSDKTADLLHAIRIDEDRLQGLATDFADGAITRAEWFTARDRITGRLETNRQQLNKQNGHSVLDNLVGAGEEVRERWDSATLDWRRAVVGAVVDHIVIMPTRKGTRKFDPALVQIVWRF